MYRAQIYMPFVEVSTYIPALEQLWISAMLSIGDHDPVQPKYRFFAIIEASMKCSM